LPAGRYAGKGKGKREKGKGKREKGKGKREKGKKAGRDVGAGVLARKQ
jgi:hypothetical protein